MTRSNDLHVEDFIEKPIQVVDHYGIVTAEPAIGIIYIINNFISGHLRMRGKGGGRYPFQYLEFIESTFGRESHTIEVCSGSVSEFGVMRVDVDLNTNPNLVKDGQTLEGIDDNTYDRWRCDPPYNELRAEKMYGCALPSLSKLLKAGARVVKPGSLMFLLCAQNYQIC